MRGSLLIEHLDELYAVAGPAPRSGRRQGDHQPIADAAIACEGGVIIFVGTTAEARAAVSVDARSRTIDGRGRSLVPGFVDAHTHLVFAGARDEELRRRLAGATYADIAAAGGGILATVAATRAASEDQLVAAAHPRLGWMLAEGTTTAEAKSGYGLDVETERRLLRAIGRLSAEQPIELAATFLGAHAVPPEFRGRRSEYVRFVIDEMLPQTAGLAESCDVFCDEGFFTPDESREILTAGRRLGLEARIHADELASSGGAEVAAAVEARSADHLLYVSSGGVAALAGAGVTAILLPAAAFFLRLRRWAPARRLVEAGVPVALGSDVNPGGGFSPSMRFAMALACFMMDLTFEEALTAATLNAAYSLGRHDRIGSLEPGKQFDAVLVDGTATNLLHVNAPSIQAVFKAGHIVSGSLGETRGGSA